MFLLPSAREFLTQFNPASIAGLQGWWKADAGVFSDAGTTLAVDGSKVQQWNDQSGNGKNATQSTSGLRPVFRTNIGGKPALQFTGDPGGSSTQLLAGANADFASQAFTCFVVYQQTAWNIAASGSGGQTLAAVVYKGAGNATPNASWGYFAAAGAVNNPSVSYRNMFETAYGGAGSPVSNDDARAASQLIPDLIAVKRSASGGKFIYRNGFLSATGSDQGNAINAGATPLAFGNAASVTVFTFTGYIMEALYYNKELLDTDRNSVEAYLRTKWGLPGNLVLSAAGDFNTPPNQNSKLNVFVSQDFGASFPVADGVTNPVFTFPGTGGIGTTTDTQATNTLFWKGSYYNFYEVDVHNFVNPTELVFSIAKAPAPQGPWTYLTDVQIFSSTLPQMSTVWNPRPFIDVDGSLVVLVQAQNGGTFDAAIQPYIVRPLNDALTSWGPAVKVTGTFPPSMIDCFLITPAASPNGKYVLFFKSENDLILKYGYMSSASLLGPYTVTVPAINNLFGWPDPGAENLFMVQFTNGSWRAWASQLGPNSPFNYTDNPDGKWTTWSPVQALKNYGNWMGTGSIIPTTLKPAAFSGAGDVVSGAKGWWGLRAYNAAAVGTNAVKLRRDSDNTTQNFAVLADGNLDITAIKTFKGTNPHVTLWIDTFYDQTGNGNHLIQTDPTKQIRLILDFINGSLPIAEYATQSTGSSTGYFTSGAFVQAQPFSMSWVLNRLANSTSIPGTCNEGFAVLSDSNIDAFYPANQNQVAIGAGTGYPTATVVEGNAFHAVQIVVNGASSVINFDGVGTTVSPGALGAVGPLNGMGGGGQDYLCGYFCEAGFWPVAFSAAQQAALYANQSSYWGGF